MANQFYMKYANMFDENAQPKMPEIESHQNYNMYNIDFGAPVMSDPRDIRRRNSKQQAVVNINEKPTLTNSRSQRVIGKKNNL